MASKAERAMNKFSANEERHRVSKPQYGGDEITNIINNLQQITFNSTNNNVDRVLFIEQYTKQLLNIITILKNKIDALEDKKRKNTQTGGNNNEQSIEDSIKYQKNYVNQLSALTLKLNERVNALEIQAGGGVFDSAKKLAKQASDKANELAKQASDKANELAKESRIKANKFTTQVSTTASKVVNQTKKIFNKQEFNIEENLKYLEDTIPTLLNQLIVLNTRVMTLEQLEQPQQLDQTEQQPQQLDQTEQQLEQQSGGSSSLNINSKKPAFVLFYADWCGHCTAFKPTWDLLKGAANKKIDMLQTNVDADYKAFNVDSFPTMKLINGKSVINYNGGRDPHDIANFINSVLKSDVIKLDIS